MTNTGNKNPFVQNEAEYKDLFDNANDLIHVLHPDGIIIYVNNAWLRTLGFSAAEVAGKSIYDFVDAPHRAPFIQYRESVLANTAGQKEAVLTFTTKSGAKILAEGFVSARYEDGRLMCTRGIFRDITARVASENALLQMHTQLKEREENLHQLIMHAPDAIIVIDTDSYIVFWNPKAAQMFGWTAEEVAGQQLSERIIPPAYRAAHHQGMKRYLASGKAVMLNQTIEITALNKAGDEFYISLTISNAVFAGKPAFISFIRDITEQKKNEYELKKKRDELEASAQELEQYAWLTSHDLREPLRKIITFSDLMLTDSELLPPKAAVRAGKIYSAAMRMHHLILSVLEYSSVNAAVHAFEDTDLGMIVNEVLTDLEVPLERTGAVMSVGTLPVIEAIPFQMRQLFQNLIGNALKYSGDSPRVQITCAEAGAKAVCIAVQDHGIGIKAADMEKIFRPFQRLHTAATTEGSGVGLAICKKIVEAHHGSIAVTSTPGAGTTFTVTLPTQQRSVF